MPSILSACRFADALVEFRRVETYEYLRISAALRLAHAWREISRDYPEVEQRSGAVTAASALFGYTGLALRSCDQSLSMSGVKDSALIVHNAAALELATVLSTTLDAIEHDAPSEMRLPVASEAARA